MTKVLANSQNQFQNHIDCTIQSGACRPNSANETGAYQPPRNMTEASAETRMMLAYSARKNIANAMPEYSTMWPATISDSPSTTSNGARLVSAIPEMTYTTKIGSSGSQFQLRKLTPWLAAKPRSWPRTMSVMLRLAQTLRTTTSAKPLAI